MGLLESTVKGAIGGLVVGVGLGLGLVLIAPVVCPALKEKGGPAARGMAKAAVRGCMDLMDKLNEITAEVREQVGDLVAEVKAERQAEAAAGTEAEGDG